MSYVLDSVMKTPTATALVCLVAEERVELEAPVRLAGIANQAYDGALPPQAAGIMEGAHR
jgi:CubicO group peptidase (beta-lactamase class C family)